MCPIDSVTQFVETIYKLSGAQDAEATDHIFNVIDDLLCDGEFEKCDSILRCIDISRLSTFSMRSFLIITCGANDRLPSRRDFYGRVEAAMIGIKGPEYTRKIIGRLC